MLTNREKQERASIASIGNVIARIKVLNTVGDLDSRAFIETLCTQALDMVTEILK